jgi:hypothetical protein
MTAGQAGISTHDMHGVKQFPTATLLSISLAGLPQQRIEVTS